MGKGAKKSEIKDVIEFIIQSKLNRLPETPLKVYL